MVMMMMTTMTRPNHDYEHIDVLQITISKNISHDEKFQKTSVTSFHAFNIIKQQTQLITSAKLFWSQTDPMSTRFTSKHTWQISGSEFVGGVRAPQHQLAIHGSGGDEHTRTGATRLRRQTADVGVMCVTLQCCDRLQR
jgi:hypothetical protein